MGFRRTSRTRNFDGDSAFEFDAQTRRANRATERATQHTATSTNERACTVLAPANAYRTPGIQHPGVARASANSPARAPSAS